MNTTITKGYDKMMISDISKKERRAKYMREHRKKYPEKAAVIARKSYLKHQIRRKLEIRCWKVGISTKEYLEMFRMHNGKCGICGVSHLELDKSLCIDHDHKTGRVRGLLCQHCNKLLGFSNDNPNLLEKAIVYLQNNYKEI